MGSYIRQGNNQSEVNNVGIGYFTITTIILSFILSNITDNGFFGFILFFVLWFIVQTKFGDYLIYAYSIGWGIFGFSLAISSQHWIIAIIVGFIVAFFALSLGLSAKEFYDDVNYMGYDD